MANESVVPFSLDEYFQSTPVGSVDRAIGNNLYGINHRQIPGLVPSNKDTYGLVFFTRPQLNLQAGNIRMLRQFFPMLTDDVLTIQRFVRTTLDPRLIAGFNYRGKEFSSGDYIAKTSPTLSCPMVDNTQAFIPILTNNINSISGWPDIVAQVFDSEPGVANQVYSQVDGITDYYEAFDLEATFRNTRGDPILYMFYVWLHYKSAVFKGIMAPYIDYITNNRIDYNTRIYRLVLDQTKTYVTKIAATGAAFPISVPTGSFFDFTNERPFNDQNKDINIRFRCLGVRYLDDRLIKDFNDTVGIFKPEMRTDSSRASAMELIDDIALPYFNNRGYPRINPNSYKLEWWVDKTTYTNRSKFFGVSSDSDTAAPSIQPIDDNVL